MRPFTFRLTVAATPDPFTFRATLASAAVQAEGRVVLSADLVAPLHSDDKALADRGAQLLAARRANPALDGGLRAVVVAADGAPLQLLVATPAPSRAAFAPSWAARRS